MMFQLLAGAVASSSSSLLLHFSSSLCVLSLSLSLVFNSGFGLLLIQLQRVLGIFIRRDGLFLPGLASQIFSLFQGVRQRYAQGLRQQQRQHSDNKGQDSHDELHRGRDKKWKNN